MLQNTKDDGILNLYFENIPLFTVEQIKLLLYTCKENFIEIYMLFLYCIKERGKNWESMIK